MRSTFMIVKSQRRGDLAQKINDAINQIGPNNVICIVMDEAGKFSEAMGVNVLASARAYIYYKINVY